MSQPARSFLLTTKCIALACLCSSITNGQSAEATAKEPGINKFYMQMAFGPTTHNGFVYDFNLQAAFKHNWTGSFTYQHIYLDPKEMPSDFERGYQLILLFPIYDSRPDANLNILSFTGGRRFPVSRKIWFGTEAGLSVVTGNEITFTPQKVTFDNWYSSSNYAYTSIKKTTFGGMLKADFNWAFSSYFGMGVSAFANFNSLQSPVGCELKFMVGWLNNKKK